MYIGKLFEERHGKDEGCYCHFDQAKRAEKSL